MATLIWITHGAFRLRAQQLEAATKRVAAATAIEKDAQYHPHPHPQYPFQDIPSLNRDREHQHEGLRLRTVMISNVPHSLRSEKDLKEYFEYYMSRPLDKPSMGLTSSTQPGFFNKIFSFLFNRAKRIPLPTSTTSESNPHGNDSAKSGSAPSAEDVPVIIRVVIARKMTELASLLERREDVLRHLETAHIKLAKKTLLAVSRAMDQRLRPSRTIFCRPSTELPPDNSAHSADVEHGDVREGSVASEECMDVLIRALAPYVEEFGLCQESNVRSKNAFPPKKSKHRFRKLRMQGSEDNNEHALPSADVLSGYPPSPAKGPHDQHDIIWEALCGLERSLLDAYQPLVHLSHVFRGQTVPAIDFYNAKLGLLNSLITENRAKAITDYDPVSTAFVTFADPNDARKACRYLAVHPNNPLMCLVTMAPMYEDLDWIRVMKSTFRAEVSLFSQPLTPLAYCLKVRQRLCREYRRLVSCPISACVLRLVLNIGGCKGVYFVLADSCITIGQFGVNPEHLSLSTKTSTYSLSLFQSRINFAPQKAYLDRHNWEEELIQSFLPTLLVALLALLIPLILLLIAKKAHTITTLSALHDRIMIRYYKFLIVNVLVFFCVGTAALQSFLLSFKSKRPNILNVVADSFPTAGPFYVGWRKYTLTLYHNNTQTTNM
jgi:hypothetical protein